MESDRRMSSYDFIFLSPTEVYKKYGRVPYSFIFHVMSLLLVTIVILQSDRIRVRDLVIICGLILWKHVKHRDFHSQRTERWRDSQYFLVEPKELLKDTNEMLAAYFAIEKATVDDWFVFDSDDGNKSIIKPPLYTAVSRLPDDSPDSAPATYDPGRSRLSTKVETIYDKKIPGILGEYTLVNNTFVPSKGYMKWLLNLVYVSFTFRLVLWYPGSRILCPILQSLGH